MYTINSFSYQAGWCLSNKYQHSTRYSCGGPQAISCLNPIATRYIVTLHTLVAHAPQGTYIKHISQHINQSCFDGCTRDCTFVLRRGECNACAFTSNVRRALYIWSKRDMWRTPWYYGASVRYICIYIVERHACEQYHKHFVVYQYILQSHDNFHSSIHSFIVSMQL